MPTGRIQRLGILGNLAAVALVAAGCEHMNNTEKGAAIGGGTGAVLGTAVGAATGRPLLGAAVGAAAGTAGGALVGNDIDKQERREKDFQQAQALAAAQVQQQRLGLTDVVHMAQQGHDDQVIINQIRSSGSTFQLAPSDLDYLKNNGVSARVIAEMQAARGPATAAVVGPPGPTTVIYGAPYPPPVYIRPAPVVVFPYRPYYGGYYRRW